MNRRKKAKEPPTKSQQITNYFGLRSEDKTFEPRPNLTLPVPLSKPKPQSVKSAEKVVGAAAERKTSRLRHSEREKTASKPPARTSSPGLTTDEMLDHMLADGQTADVPGRKMSATTSRPPVAKRSCKRDSKSKWNETADRAARIEADLERLANERIGALGEFPTDSSSDDDEVEKSGEDTMNLSQGSARGQFIARTRDVIDGAAGETAADSDVLHIHVTFRGYSNLLRSPNVYVVQPGDPPSALAGVYCAPFELLFLLAPTHPNRRVLLAEFCQRHGAAGRRLAVAPRRLSAVLRFITQAFDCDNVMRFPNRKLSTNSDDDEPSAGIGLAPRQGGNGNGGPVVSMFDAHFPKRFDDLLRLAAAVERRRVAPVRRHTRASPLPPRNAVDWRLNRDGLCLENVKLFLLLFPYLDLSAWKSAKTAALLMRLAVIYVEELAGAIRAKIISAIQMLLDALDTERVDRVVARFLDALATTRGMDGRALLLFITGLMSARFFTQPRRFRFMRAVLGRLRDETPADAVVAQPAAVSDEIDELDDPFESGEEPAESQPLPTAEVHTGIIDMFVVFGEVARLLASRPTDVYVIMQLMGLCVTDPVIHKEPTETLVFMRDLLNDVLKDVSRNRLDGVLLRSMNDLAHRIGMVVQRRRGTHFEIVNNAAKRHKYYSTSSSSWEDGIDGDEEDEVERTSRKQRSEAGSTSDEDLEELEAAGSSEPTNPDSQGTMNLSSSTDSFDENPL